MSFLDHRDVTAENESLQLAYQNEVVANGAFCTGFMGFMNALRNRARVAEVLGGQGYTWFVDTATRATAGHADASQSYAYLTSSNQSGAQLSILGDRKTLRTTISQAELDNLYRLGGSAHTFVDVLEKVTNDKIKVVNSIFPTLFMRDGLTVAAATDTGSPVINDDGTATSVEVDNVDAFIKDHVYEIVSADGGTTRGRVRCSGRSTRFGQGDVSFINLDTSGDNSGDITVTAGDLFRPAYATINSPLHGLDYIVSDGATNSETGFATYPRAFTSSTAAGATNQHNSVTRTDAAYTDSLQGIVLERSKNLDYSVLDDAYFAISEQADASEINYADENIGRLFDETPFVCLMNTRGYQNLVKEARALGRNFNQLQGDTEVQGFRSQDYNNMVIHHSPLCPRNRMYMLNLRDYVFRFDEPYVSEDMDIMGLFKRDFGTDRLEHVATAFSQLFATKPGNSVKVTDLTD